MEVYTKPRPAEYESRLDYTPGQLVPVIIGGNQVGEISVEDTLPRRTL